MPLLSFDVVNLIQQSGMKVKDSIKTDHFNHLFLSGGLTFLIKSLPEEFFKKECLGISEIE